MKVKTLVAMGVSSLLAVSIAYATPSALNTQLVDDATGTQPATNDINANPGAMDSNSAANPGAASTDTNNMPSGTGDASNANPGSDEDTQDTATGDSDY